MGSAQRFGAPPAAGIDARRHAPYGWAPLVVLFLAGLVDRVEYSLLSGVLPLIQDEWGISDTAAGSIPTASALAAVVVTIPAGYLADRRRRTRIIAVVVFCWALATLGSGLAAGFAMFYVMRVFLATAESIDNPAAGSLLADFYPSITRAKVFGWWRMSAYLGGLGTVLGGVLGQAFGWRGAFLIMVIPGVLTAVACWLLHEPARGLVDRVDPAVESDIQPHLPFGPQQSLGAQQPFGAQLREVLRIRSLMIIAIGQLALSMGITGVFFWMPSLMGRTFDLETGPAGSLTGAVTLVGVVGGTLFGAWLGHRWHGSVPGARVLIGSVSTTAGSAILGAALTMGSVASFALVTLVAVFVMATAIPTLTAAVADVVAAPSRGIGFGIAQLLIAIGMAAGPLVVGIASDRTGSLTTALYVVIVPMLLGGMFTMTARGAAERDAARVLAAARRTTQ